MDIKSININGEDYFRKKDVVLFFKAMYEEGQRQAIEQNNGQKAAASGCCLFLQQYFEQQ